VKRETLFTFLLFPARGGRRDATGLQHDVAGFSSSVDDRRDVMRDRGKGGGRETRGLRRPLQLTARAGDWGRRNRRIF